MAETRHSPYSFYVPENDEQLVRFVKAQSNLSLSVRMLMKAFIAANKGVMRDAASEDLLDLVHDMELPAAQNAEKALPATEHKQQAPDPVPAAKAEPAPVTDAAGQGTEEAAVTGSPTETHQEDMTEQQDVQAPPAGGPGQAIPHREADDTVIVPEVEEEPEKPMKLVGSERSAYNAAKSPQTEASMDDLMSMMGDGM